MCFTAWGTSDAGCGVGLGFDRADAYDIFYDPVTDEACPGYSEQISSPMSLSVMKEKLESGRYQSADYFSLD